ncbi:MAG: hypothetical protein AB7I25_01930 [Vicinamibacterales bacterium]
MKKTAVTLGGAVASLVGIAVFVWSWLYRYVDLDGPVAGLSDDHFFYLTRGWQILYGEWPDRDFVDPGAPLTFVLAALTQVVGGRGTGSEILFTVTMLSIATALTFWAARRASGSTLVGLGAAVFQAVLLPRYYNYPKVLIYAAAFPLLWSYVDAPTTKKRIALAVFSVVALLLRHDHGAFIGLACVATILLQTHVGWLPRLKHLAAYGLLTVACALPYLGWLQLNGGVLTHVRTANSYSQRDRERAPLILPAFALTPQSDEDRVPDDADWWERGVFEQAARNYEPWLFWLLLALPLATLAGQAGSVESRNDWPHARQKLIVVAGLGLLLFWGFIRGNLAIRFGDVGVTTAVCAAWLLRTALRRVTTGPFVLRVATATMTLAVLAGTVFVLFPPVRTRLDNTGMLDRPLGAYDRAIAMRQRLVTWPLEGWLDRDRGGTSRLIYYVRDCTADDDRVFISPYMAEVHALARRPFPAGHADLRPSFYKTGPEQQLAVERLQRQRVPLAIMPAGDDYGGIEREMPRIDAWLRIGFREHGDVDLGNGSRVKLFVRRDREVRGTYRDTGWPCLR